MSRRCAQCDQPPVVRAQWDTSTGSQDKALCRSCAQEFWDRFKNAITFNFSPIVPDEVSK